MQKSFVLAAGFLLALSGCQSKSPTWQKVVTVSRATGDAEDGPRAYAGELHRTLSEAAVPHKVVTFEFVYSGNFDPFAKTQRTAVIYQDSASIKHPWWLMDQTLDGPVWLPNGSVEKQVSFYLRRPATVVDVRDYSSLDDKDIRPTESPRRREATSRIQPVVSTTGSRKGDLAHGEAPEAKRPGFFQRGIFAPRTRVADVPAKPSKPPATTRIQPVAATKVSKPVPVDDQETFTEAPPWNGPPKGSVAAEAKPVQKAAETPAKGGKKAAKVEASVAPKGALGSNVPLNAPAPWEEPVVLEPRGNTAVSAVPKPGSGRKHAPLITQPVDKPKAATPKFRKPLISQPEEAAVPKPSAEAARPGLLRRIFGGNWGRRAVTRA